MLLLQPIPDITVLRGNKWNCFKTMNVLGGNKLNCFKATQMLGGLTHILIWASELAKGPTR